MSAKEVTRLTTPLEVEAMRRDMELIRSILLRIEEKDELGKSDDYGVDRDTWVGHVMLIDEAGFIDGIEVGEPNRPDSPPSVYIMRWLRLTNYGHDFLDAAQDDSIWDEAMEKTEKVGGRVSTSLLIAILIEIAKDRLGLNS